MSNNKASVSRYALIAGAAAFVVMFGAVWFAASLGGGIRGEADAARPALPDSPVKMTDQLARPPDPRASIPRCAPRVVEKPRRITPKDMFPVGDITRDMPHYAHPFRQTAELFPSFEYGGGVWLASGRYVRAWQADLTPTGYRLAGGRKLYALADTAPPDPVLFVQSAIDPTRFAIYRRA